jgi:AcrR family transcriptional regulator
MKRIVKDPKERKSELIDVAECLFMASGYEQTAISDIVREVNVSQGAFYYYFASKEDILLAVLKKNILIMERDLQEIADRECLDEAIRINCMANCILHFTGSGKKILGYVHQEKSGTLHKKLTKVNPFSNIAPIMAKVISEGVQKGRFDVAQPIETSYLLIVLLASARYMLYQMNAACKARCGEERLNRDLVEKENAEDEVGSENMKIALEDILGRTLKVNDYKFTLDI